MSKRAPRLLVAIVLALCPNLVSAQSFEPVGTRASGMAGAFVAVADDASAVYWNPGALAAGSFFGLVLDHNVSSREPDEGVNGSGTRSAFLAALSTPAVGVSYYRFRATTATPQAASPTTSRLENLITHQTGVTLVQSLFGRLSVGTTVKLVRGVAASAVALGTDSKALVDQAEDLVGNATNKFDADVGVLGVFGTLRAGLTVRNVGEPKFQTVGNVDEIGLDRHVRAGVAVATAVGVMIAVDSDITTAHGPAGDIRDLAIGGEARVLSRLYARAGTRFNTIGDQPGGRTPTVSFGGTYAVLSSILVDGQLTTGSSGGGTGWGVAGRVVF